MLRHDYLFAAALAALSAAAPTTSAVSYTWTNPAGGTWSDAANWNPSTGFPAASPDDAFFNLGPTDPAAFAAYPGYAVTFSTADPSLANLTLATDKLTLTGDHAQFREIRLAMSRHARSMLNLTAGLHATAPVGATIADFGGQATLNLYTGSSLNTSQQGTYVGFRRGGTNFPSLGIVNISGASSLVTGNLSIGTSGGTGHVTIDGPDSTIVVGSPGHGGTLTLGDLWGFPLTPTSGTGTLLITNGATVEINHGFNLLTGSSLTLAGRGSSISDVAGSSIFGQITASDGAALHTDHYLSLHGGSSLSLSAASATAWDGFNYGSLTLSAGATLTATRDFENYGTLAGSGTLDTDLLLRPSSILVLSLTSPSAYDRLTGMRSLRVDGALSLTADPSYTPQLHDSFDLLGFSSRSGTSTFSSLSLPPLPPHLSWDTSALYTTGTISITPEPTTLAPFAAASLLLKRRRPRQH